MADLSRRELLKAAGAAAPIVLGVGPLAQSALGQVIGQAPNGIVKPLPPNLFVKRATNAEMKWEAMRGVGQFTPNERFFVRNHTATPRIDPRTWRLSIFGSALRDPKGRTFTYRELYRMPSVTVDAFVECAGNGRSFFARQQRFTAAGTQWDLGAIGVARWRGVPLRDLLEAAGITRRAVDLMPEGLDQHVIMNGKDEGRPRRPLPVDKALDDVIVAYEMNGQPLPPDHGFPARLIVPGWVGMANIKWLGQIEVADHHLYSFWNTEQYRLAGPAYPADAPPLEEQSIKSALELRLGAKLRAGATTRITGRSWSGKGRIARVDVKVPGVTDWQPARLAASPKPDQWVRWSFDFRPPGPGDYEIVARATDRSKRVQPEAVKPNKDGYLFWAQVRHPVVAA